jgi:hypothetical protein
VNHSQNRSAIYEHVGGGCRWENFSFGRSLCFRPVDGVEEDKSGQCAWVLPFSMAGAGRCRRPLNRKSPRRVTMEGVNQFLRCDRLFCIPFVSFAAFESADKAKRKGAALVTRTRLLTAPFGDHLFALFRKEKHSGHTWDRCFSR